MTVPPRIQRLIDGRQMDAVMPDVHDIVGRRTKAIASNRDARLAGLSRDNAVTLGYQAALQAATAVLEAAGYRTRGSSGGHHHSVFYALAGLGLAGFSTVDIESERIRRVRTAAFYGAEEATTEQVAALFVWLDGLLPIARQALRSLLPADVSLRET